MKRYGRVVILLTLAIALMGVVHPDLFQRSGRWNHYVLQAHAFLQGQLNIDDYFGDVAYYDGHCYVVFPPFPALLITPFVAVFGFEMRTAVIALALTLSNLYFLNRILLHLVPETQPRRWLLAAFFLGSAYWPTLFSAHEAWDFAHLVAVSTILPAIAETFGRRRAWLVGLLCGAAILSRQLCIYSVPFFMVALWCRDPCDEQPRGSGGVSVGLFLLPVAAAIAAYLAFNAARFGSPFETGYQYLGYSGFLDARVSQYGLFHPVYIPFNLIHLFLQGPHIEFSGDTLLHLEGLDPFGTSLTFASPFLFIALLARWKRPLLWTAWLAVVATIAHVACYHNNGWTQYNTQRFSLDFLPILIVLVALGVTSVRDIWWKAAIGYAVALNVLALLLLPILKKTINFYVCVLTP